jgi:hypothetical protein
MSGEMPGGLSAHFLEPLDENGWFQRQDLLKALLGGPRGFRVVPLESLEFTAMLVTRYKP